jgi:hypothetical protein
MASQLAEHPLANHGTFRRVMKDVDFPEAEQNFARQQFAIDGAHCHTRLEAGVSICNKDFQVISSVTSAVIRD